MLVAGLMSGTSADGIDAALVEITGLGWKTRIQPRAFGSVPYPPIVRRRILAIAGGASISAGEVSQMNFLLGELFARACRSVCRRAGISWNEVALIGSHGQTIFHQNSLARYCGKVVRSTLQIGEPAIIAERMGITPVGDFRPADVAAGGQGAPLVPFFDYLFYRHARRGRIVLNIGGIANLTAIPAGSEPEEVIAFDTGPGNMLLDSLTALATRGHQSYDRDGRLAAQGRIGESQVERMMRQPYFRKPPPKTAGREQFGQAYLEQHFLNRFNRENRMNRGNREFQDALATAAALTAETIARAVGDFVVPKFPVAECFVSGGGAKNRFLMEQLAARLRRVIPARGAGKRKEICILPAELHGIPADAKEAAAFAVLAYQTFHRQPSNLPAATGARHPAILGKVVYGNG